MSVVTKTGSVAPPTPSTGKSSSYVDTTGRDVTINSTGVVNVLTADNLYNYARNGGFWFAQRQAPATATTYSSTAGRAISADGFGITNENASATYQRTDISGAPEGLSGRYYGNFLKITTTGKLVVSQVIEGTDTMALRGRTVRVTCLMKQLVGAAPVVNIGLAQLAAAGTIDTIPATFISAFGANSINPTLGTNLAYLTPRAGVTGDGGTVNGNVLNCTLTSAWVRYSVVFDVPTDCKNLVLMFFGNAQFAATNGFALSQVMLTNGQEIQDWNPQSLGLELLKCLRFYQKDFLIDTAPAQNIGVNTGETRAIAGKGGVGANGGFIPWTYQPPLRATPTTLTVYNPAAANALARNVTGAADMGATTITGSTANNAYTNSSGVAATNVGDLIAIHWSADAEL